MPPKKADKGPKPAVKKEAVDKVRLCPLYLTDPLANDMYLDIWHEKCTGPTSPSSCPSLQSFKAIEPPNQEINADSRPSKQKKGAQAQKYVAQVQQQAAQAQTPEQKRKAAEKAQREKEKAASEAAKREAAELFKPVQVQKVPFGVDPKTVVCIFYKQGNCEKGKKCKFSHDLAVERRGEKKNLYQDTRDAQKEGDDEAKKKDDMADWDEGLYPILSPFPFPIGYRSVKGCDQCHVADLECENREAPPSRAQQTRQSENHDGQSLQTLHRRR